MKKFSEKAFYRSGVLDALKDKVFYKNGAAYIFACWYYEKGRYTFIFKKHNGGGVLLVGLFWQHLDDFKDTAKRIFAAFDVVC